MSDQETLTSFPVLVAAVRRWVHKDPRALGRLLDEICSDLGASSFPASTCKDAVEAVALAETLGYPTWEVIEAAASLGLPRTVEFLRQESTAQFKAKPISAQIM